MESDLEKLHPNLTAAVILHRMTRTNCIGWSISMSKVVEIIVLGKLALDIVLEKLVLYLVPGKLALDMIVMGKLALDMIVTGKLALDMIIMEKLAVDTEKLAVEDDVVVAAAVDRSVNAAMVTVLVHGTKIRISA